MGRLSGDSEGCFEARNWCASQRRPCTTGWANLDRVGLAQCGKGHGPPTVQHVCQAQVLVLFWRGNIFQDEVHSEAGILSILWLVDADACWPCFLLTFCVAAVFCENVFCVLQHLPCVDAAACGAVELSHLSTPFKKKLCFG